MKIKKMKTREGKKMIFPIPDFVPVPGSEMMQTLSLIALCIGVCFICMGIFLMGKKAKAKRMAWFFIVIGTLLVLNHSIQLLFQEVRI